MSICYRCGTPCADVAEVVAHKCWTLSERQLAATVVTPINALIEQVNALTQCLAALERKHKALECSVDALRGRK
jgi:hypothetical protein